MGSAVCGSKIKDFVLAPGLLNDSFESSIELNDIICKDPNDSIDDLTILALSIRCTNLFSENRFQLLSPIAYIFIQDGSSYIKKAETEIIISTLNPFFQQTVRVAFGLKYNLNLKIEIHDSQMKMPGKALIGSCIYNVHELAAHGDMVSKELMKSSKKTGNISVSAKELKLLNDLVSIKWEFVPIRPENSYCMLRVSRLSSGECIMVYQTETRKAPYGKK